MQYTTLGQTDLKVSKICLGTMTWGEQNSETEAFEQLDYALEQGINFIDTAELYPVPPNGETVGRTETILGNWLSSRQNRDNVVLATKVVGASSWLPHIRDGKARLDRANILAALDASLSKLQTDYIDLYQIHWPDRATNFFGQLGYTYPNKEAGEQIEATLDVLDECVKAGKIRHIGVSNETPWGVHEYLQCSTKNDAPRIVSIQNPYNLINRTFEVGLAEFSHREQVGLLAYSPLAFGVLSGKYLNGQRPENARLTLFSHFSRYNNALAQSAVAKYVATAEKHGLNPAQMALAFINQQPFVTSNIIGATTMEQLKDNIESINIELSDDVLDDIDDIHAEIPNPCP